MSIPHTLPSGRTCMVLGCSRYSVCYGLDCFSLQEAWPIEGDLWANGMLAIYRESATKFQEVGNETGHLSLKSLTGPHSLQEWKPISSSLNPGPGMGR